MSVESEIHDLHQKENKKVEDEAVKPVEIEA